MENWEDYLFYGILGCGFVINVLPFLYFLMVNSIRDYNNILF